ncbi:uncharacterized protein BO72DRAFT_292884 [Aspergillus fijiensis CBS 313.89]|uniref:Uncharacterized protein n=1 Tax=Aspergillus fijiensis CBS 313.89 TaxID=1448319 RepID=A0A8G1RFR5_9EURO|nr:uncharacterized protein BO72DRAFT_292884 [Aspergillus fijiensis CBS 313.89]RAK72059.1 hypothetical protein BO72DRAFT_292884 [Aspergillus fijiensis CBS 313.89]
MTRLLWIASRISRCHTAFLLTLSPNITPHSSSFFFSYFWLQCVHFLGLSVNNNIIWSIIPTPVPLPPPSNGCVIVIIGIVSCPHSMAHGEGALLGWSVTAPSLSPKASLPASLIPRVRRPWKGIEAGCTVPISQMPVAQSSR